MVVLFSGMAYLYLSLAYASFLSKYSIILFGLNTNC